MVEDEEGFEYPEIDEDACVRCQQCVRVCPFK
nr:4Fe-4S binding protein [Eubacterium sp. MSJ-33]